MKAREIFKRVKLNNNHGLDKIRKMILFSIFGQEGIQAYNYQIKNSK